MSSAKAESKEKIILVVDDDALTIKMLERLLSDAGYFVISVSSGNEALIAAKNAQPDLLILDIMLPDRNGIDVALSLKKDPSTRNIPIIFLSSLLKIETHKGKIAFPRSPFLSKPLNREELLKEIEHQI